MSIKPGNTFIVPHKTLRAYLIENNNYREVVDQTVWQIQSYDKGYITGISYTMIDSTPFSKNNFVGSITPEGSVLINFYSSGSQTQGYGELIKCNKFLMQMGQITNLQGAVLGLAHWSYMIKVNPCDELYHHLPGVGISVPQFIAQFDS
jgi:hypothetical protein